MEGGAHQERGSNHWQESRDSHFSSALICPNNGIHLTGLEPSRGSMRRKPKRAGCDNNYLVALLSQSTKIQMR